MRASHRTSAALLVALVAVAVGVTSTMGQDESPQPFLEMSESRPILLKGDLAVEFPSQIGDQPWQQMTVVSGPELFAGLDPADEHDAARISENQGFLRAAGASLEDLTSVTGFRVEDDGSFSLVNAYQIAGADPSVMEEVVLQRFVQSYAQAMEDPSIEFADVGGRRTLVLRDLALTSAAGESQPIYLYAEGDTVWVLNVAEPLLEEVIGDLSGDEP